MATFRFIGAWAISILLVWAVVPVASADDPALVFTAGKETTVNLPDVGGGRFIVFVPQNYDPARAFPVIFCYHGLDGQPTTFPFRQNTGGRDFVIVGMEYFERGLKPRSSDEWRAYCKKEAQAAQAAFQFLKTHLNLDPADVAIGGVSKGGWHAGAIGEEAGSFFCNWIILNAGRTLDTRATTIPNVVRAKPVYIGVGETENNNKPGRAAADFYRQQGAVVVFEEYKGIGHAPKPDSQVLYQFLLDHGPLRDYDAQIAQADAAKKAGQLGKALSLYQQAAALLPEHVRTQSARDAAKGMLAEVETQFSTVQQSVDAKLYSAALRRLSELRRTYSGSTVADRASQWIDRFSNDPQLREQMAVAMLNQKADDIEARAKKIEADGDFAAALKVYESYLDQCKGAEHYEQVQTHYQQLKNDPKITAKADDQKVDADCREWMAMARNLISAGRKRLAKPYLQKIIDTYPDTAHAAEAKKVLDGM